MNLLLKEYILSGDREEAERCLRDLEVPHFHHEFVYEVNADRLKGNMPINDPCSCTAARTSSGWSQGF